MTISTQKATEIGESGGTVKTDNTTHQDKERIDAAVNAGKNGK